MPRTYVDNAYNRSVGRVGLPVGSAVISSSSSSSSYGASGGSYNYSRPASYNASSSSRTYVDNAFNRQAGRVGLPVGSAVISKADHVPSASFVRTYPCPPVERYVDNDFNRRAGRVGLPKGSAVISSVPQSTSSGVSRTTSSSIKTYVDNAHNRSLGRVGLPVGSAVESSVNRNTSIVLSSQNNSARSSGIYADNALNRQLGRVGKLLGSMGVKSNSRENYCELQDVDPSDVEKYFGFNPNVLETRNQRSNDSTSLLRDMFQLLLKSPEQDLPEMYNDVPDKQLSSAVSAVMQQLARVKEVKKWEDESKLDKGSKREQSLINNFTGNQIKFEDIELRSEIGRGAFGDVHAAKYCGSFIAVKKLRVQRVSRKRLQSFTDEIQIFCKLEHPNVVKFIGACVVTPNLCICMEYMKQSLHEALHVLSRNFSEKQKLRLTSNICSGLEYLHSSPIAHCDIKSQNVLIDFETESLDTTLTAKLTDFGLAMMKNNSESVSTTTELEGLRGTPRYCAPEVLRGEMMSLATWKCADVYSLSLVIFEIVCEEEPFDGLSVLQLTKQVGTLGAVPTIGEGLRVSEALKNLLARCWSRDATDRPTAGAVKTFFDGKQQLFIAA